MAQREEVTYISDLTGKPITDTDVPTLTFAFDGVDYSIDLSAKEADKFASLIRPYTEAATRTGGRRKRR